MEIKVKIIKIIDILLTYGDKSETTKYKFIILLNYGDKNESNKYSCFILLTHRYKRESNKYNNNIPLNYGDKYTAQLWRYE